MQCPECGTRVDPADVECPLCGEELHRSGSETVGTPVRADPVAAQPGPRAPVRRARPERGPFRSAAPIYVGALVLIGVILAVSLRFTMDDETEPTANVVPTAPAPTAEPGPVPESPTEFPAETPGAETEAPTATSLPLESEESALVPETEALASLQQLRDEDLAQVALDGRWVAQLASKAPGITDPYTTARNGTQTFYAVDILAEHLVLRGDASLGRVFLLLSTDYGKRLLWRGEPLWVTFADDGFSSAAGVQTWCAARFPALSGDELVNACAPRRLNPPR